MPISTFCPNNKDHGWVRTACPYCRYEDLERKLAAIRKAAELEDWQHATSCDKFEYHRRDCTCGLSDLRAALTEAGEGEKK